MNTQSDNAQTSVNLDTINLDILTMISDLVQYELEHDPEYVQDLDQFNEAIKAITKRVSKGTLQTLENSPWCLAQPFGNAMFLMGLKLGRDPMAVLTLPERFNQR